MAPPRVHGPGAPAAALMTTSQAAAGWQRGLRDASQARFTAAMGTGCTRWGGGGGGAGVAGGLWRCSR